MLDTNVKGVFLTCQTVARVMVAAERPGQLVVISSGAANTAIWGWSHYCASKAAVVMLTRAMALELGEHGIRVNAMLPGYVDVPEGGAPLASAWPIAAPSSENRRPWYGRWYGEGMPRRLMDHHRPGTAARVP